MFSSGLVMGKVYKSQSADAPFHHGAEVQSTISRYDPGMNMQKLMKQMQKAQSAQGEMQEKLEALRIEGSAGGGMVKATANGSGTIQSIQLDKVVVDPSDVEALEDLILIAIRDAQAKAVEAQQTEMQKIMGSLGGMPGMR
jgi:nucleoid-associated protein EbfC